MSDLSSQITELLSDPQTMDRIKSLSGLFGQSAQSTDSQPPAPSIAEDHGADISSLAGLGSAAEILPTVMRFMPLLNAFREDDDATRLLYAVKPFLSEQRRERLDQAIRILRILRVVPLLKDSGILNLPL